MNQLENFLILRRFQSPQNSPSHFLTFQKSANLLIPTKTLGLSKPYKPSAELLQTSKDFKKKVIFKLKKKDPNKEMVGFGNRNDKMPILTRPESSDGLKKRNLNIMEKDQNNNVVNILNGNNDKNVEINFNKYEIKILQEKNRYDKNIFAKKRGSKEEQSEKESKKMNNDYILSAGKTNKIINYFNKNSVNKNESNEKKGKHRRNKFSEDMRRTSFSFTFNMGNNQSNVKNDDSKSKLLVPCSENSISFKIVEIPNINNQRLEKKRDSIKSENIVLRNQNDFSFTGIGKEKKRKSFFIHNTKTRNSLSFPNQNLILLKEKNKEMKEGKDETQNDNKEDLLKELLFFSGNDSLNQFNKSLNEIWENDKAVNDKEYKLSLHFSELEDSKKIETEVKEEKNIPIETSNLEQIIPNDNINNLNKFESKGNRKKSPSLKRSKTNILVLNAKNSNFCKRGHSFCLADKGKLPRFLLRKKTKLNKQLSRIPETTNKFAHCSNTSINLITHCYSSSNLKTVLILSLNEEEKIHYPKTPLHQNGKSLLTKLIRKLNQKKNKIDDLSYSSYEKGDIEDDNSSLDLTNKKSEVNMSGMTPSLNQKNLFDYRHGSIRLTKSDFVFNYGNPKAQKVNNKFTNQLIGKLDSLEVYSIKEKDQLLSKALLEIINQKEKMDNAFNENQKYYTIISNDDSICKLVIEKKDEIFEQSIQIQEDNIFFDFSDIINMNLFFSNFKPISNILFSIYFDIFVPYFIYKKEYLTKEIEKNQKNIIDEFKLEKEKECKKLLGKSHSIIHKKHHHLNYDYIFKCIDFENLPFYHKFLNFDFPKDIIKKDNSSKLKLNLKKIKTLKFKKVASNKTNKDGKNYLSKKSLSSFKSAIASDYSFEKKLANINFTPDKSINSILPNTFFTRNRDEAENLYIENIIQIQENTKREKEFQRQQLFSSPFMKSWKNHKKTLKEIKEEESQKDNNSITKEITMVKTNKIKLNIIKKINNYYDSLLFFMKDGNNRRFKEVFKKYNTNTELLDKNGNSFLNLAAQACNLELSIFLLSKGANINSQNFKGNTPLHYALSNKNYELSDLLLQYGANEQIKNHCGLTPWQCLKSTNSII